jgi:hypothetical protein
LKQPTANHVLISPNLSTCLTPVRRIVRAIGAIVRRQDPVKQLRSLTESRGRPSVYRSRAKRLIVMSMNVFVDPAIITSNLTRAILGRGHPRS